MLKAVAQALLVLGALLIALGFYQVNQLIIAGSATATLMQELGALTQTLGAEAATGVAKQLSQAQTLLQWIATLDFIAGAAAIALGAYLSTRTK